MMGGSGTGVLAPRRNDWRARRHPGFLLAMAHRISGIALAAFLPLVFAMIALRIQAISLRAWPPRTRTEDDAPAGDPRFEWTLPQGRVPEMVTTSRGHR